jgi:hypothetical protein
MTKVTSLFIPDTEQKQSDFSCLEKDLYTAATAALLQEKSVILSHKSPDHANFHLSFIADGNQTTSDKAQTTLLHFPAVSTPLGKPPANATLINNSIHCYTGRDGQLVTAHLIPDSFTETGIGTSQLYEPLPPALYDWAQNLQNRHNLSGPWHCQSDADRQVTLHHYANSELTPLFCALGINWYAFMMYEAAGRAVGVEPQGMKGRTELLGPNGTDYRLFEPFRALYLDLDDTLIIHDKLNDRVLRLISRLQDANVPIHLITRHYRDPEITLKERGLSSQSFASVIWITDGVGKSAYITDKDAIFIDDSFHERREVASQCNIPCLPPDAAALLWLSDYRHGKD